MNFKRLTSVFFCCALLSSFLVVPASAEFTSSDSRTLTDIYKVIQYLNLSPASWQRNSVIGFLERILDRIPTNLSTNFQLLGGEGTNSLLKSNRDYVQNLYNYIAGDNIKGNLNKIQQNTLASADRLLNTNSLLSGTNTLLTGIKNSLPADNSEILNKIYTIMGGEKYEFLQYDMLSYLRDIYSSLDVFNFDDETYSETDENGNEIQYYTPFHYLVRLADVLANDDDKAIREAQKENTETAKDKFLSGQSGRTSLGKDDFSNVSDVGGTLNDTFNMGGTSKVSDFVSGFGSAGTESQSWFSQTTANNLDGVTAAGNSTSGVSTFADDCETMVDVDPDPYNMAEIAERYEWLEGASE